MEHHPSNCVLKLKKKIFKNAGGTQRVLAASVGGMDRRCFRSGSFFRLIGRLGKRGWHSGTAGRAAVSQCQRPKFVPDLQCVWVWSLHVLLVTYMGLLRVLRFLPTLQKKNMQVCRLIGLCTFSLGCKDWMRKWDNVERMIGGPKGLVSLLYFPIKQPVPK